MGTRSAPRAKAKRLQRLKKQRARSRAGSPGEFGAQSATWNTSSGPAASPAAAAQAWAESREELSTTKQVAAAALILGQNVSKTASALGVDRRTIQRWRKLDPEFQLAMAETKQEVVVSSRQYILAMAETAVGVVEVKLNDEQNARVALGLLRGIGVLSPDALDERQYGEILELRKAQDEAAQEQQAEQNQPKHEFGAQSATLGMKNGELTGADQGEEVYELSDLTPPQRLAVSGFIAGGTLAEVARLTQTTESTVRGWLCLDRPFFSVLSEFQFERIQHLKFRLLLLIQRAMEIVSKAIEAGDGRIAMSLLRGLGLMS